MECVSWTFYGDILNYSFISSIEMLVVLIKLVLILLKQAPGMEELIWEQYTVTLQKVSVTYVISATVCSCIYRSWIFF